MRLRSVLATVFLATSPSASALEAQSKAPLLGRWDLTFDAPGMHKAGWLEVRRSGTSTLVGAVVTMTGSSRPIAKVQFDSTSQEFRFTIPSQWDDALGDNTFSGRLEGGAIIGTLAYAAGRQIPFRGVRAPTLRRTAPPAWGTPIKLTNGKDLAGWKTRGETSHWKVENGIVRNLAAGADLVTEGTYTDFKLHVEFRYPPKSNSGIYLRGRYEVQVEDTPYDEPQLDGLGAIYGHIRPNQVAALKPGEWQTYDITLVGRTVTIVLNGKTVICETEIPGLTGGALDSDEGKPGPIYLQGDHGPIEYRNIVITPAK